MSSESPGTAEVSLLESHHARSLGGLRKETVDVVLHCSLLVNTFPFLRVLGFRSSATDTSFFRLPLWSTACAFPAEPVHGRRQSAGCEDQIRSAGSAGRHLTDTLKSHQGHGTLAERLCVITNCSVFRRVASNVDLCLSFLAAEWAAVLHRS